MHAVKDPIDVDRATALAQLGELETTLIAHGYSVEVERTFWVLTITQRAEVLSPAQSQRVQIACDPAGDLHWYLARDGDLEQMCPAAAIAEAVELITAALRKAARR